MTPSLPAVSAPPSPEVRTALTCHGPSRSEVVHGLASVATQARHLARRRAPSDHQAHCPRCPLGRGAMMKAKPSERACVGVTTDIGEASATPLSQ